MTDEVQEKVEIAAEKQSRLSNLVDFSLTSSL